MTLALAYALPWFFSIHFVEERLESGQGSSASKRSSSILITKCHALTVLNDVTERGSQVRCNLVQPVKFEDLLISLEIEKVEGIYL